MRVRHGGPRPEASPDSIPEEVGASEDELSVYHVRQLARGIGLDLPSAVPGHARAETQ